MRGIWIAVLGAALAACAHDTDGGRADSDSATLGETTGDTGSAGTSVQADTSRAGALQRASSASSRPARVVHATEEQQRLRDLRLQKATTTTRRITR